MENKENNLKQVIGNLQETLEFEEQLNNEMLISNYKENEVRLKEAKLIDKERNELEQEQMQQQLLKIQDQKQEELTKKRNPKLNQEEDDDFANLMKKNKKDD